jgi:ribonuclease R
MAKNSKKSKKNEQTTRNSKEEKLFQNLLKTTQQFMSGKGYSPLTEQELWHRLSLSPQNEDIFKEVINYLIESHLIEEIDNRYSWKQTNADIVTGVMKMHPRGFGFVVVDAAFTPSPDIFIPKHLTKNAVDGDTVEILINREVVSEKGPEGKVIAILARARTHIAGIIKQVDREGNLLGHVPLLGAQQRVIIEPSEERKLEVGDRIVMEIIEWGTKETATICRFSHYLGHISDPSCDIYAAIEEFQLRSDLPSRVIEEAESLGQRVSPADIAKREDLRELITVTIDPDTAKDFDDAISLTKNEDGTYQLGVHIADVSHYVKPGTALDDEARLRCNSTYFPGVCVPMLPGVLSENLCSLKPNVNRLTVSVLMHLDEKGNLLEHRMTRSVIKSSKRFTYKEAKSVLDGQKQSPHVDLLNLMVEVCKLLKHKRYERGSLEFALPELVVLVDEKGTPYATDYIKYDVTHQMIEEFMLKANEVVAWDLSQKGKNLTYRIHDLPAEENLRDFSVLANAFGFKMTDMPSPQDLQKVFEEAKETPFANQLASNYIRRMRLAAYSAENIGHYGLSLEYYCHFTSPIRRYVDLVVHRILFGESDDLEYLQQVALRCSEQERISAKAETSVVILKKLRLLQKMQQEDPHKEYQAVITRVKNFGIYFEILDLLLEGFIHISELADDYFIFEEDRMRLRGSHQGGVYAAGDELGVTLRDVDFITLESKWYVTTHPEFKGNDLSKPSNKKLDPGQKLLKKWSKEKSKKKSDKPRRQRKKPN